MHSLGLAQTEINITGASVVIKENYKPIAG